MIRSLRQCHQSEKSQVSQESAYMSICPVLNLWLGEVHKEHGLCLKVVVDSEGISWGP